MMTSDVPDTQKIEFMIRRRDTTALVSELPDSQKSTFTNMNKLKKENITLKKRKRALETFEMIEPIQIETEETPIENPQIDTTESVEASAIEIENPQIGTIENPQIAVESVQTPIETPVGTIENPQIDPKPIETKLSLLKTALNNVIYVQTFGEGIETGPQLCCISKTFLLPTEPVFYISGACGCSLFAKEGLALEIYKNFIKNGCGEYFACGVNIKTMQNTTVAKFTQERMWERVRDIVECDDMCATFKRHRTVLDTRKKTEIDEQTAPFREVIERIKEEVHNSLLTGGITSEPKKEK